MKMFITLNMFIAIFNMLPLGIIDGAKVFFGNLFLYILNLVLVIISFLLVKESIVGGLIIAFVIAIAISVACYYFYEYR